MSDLVERQTVIDWLKYKWNRSADSLFYGIQGLPSAQPEVRTQMSSADCISRQAAIDALCEDCSGNCLPCTSYQCSEIRLIQAIPSVQSEPSCRGQQIVRCKDCRHYQVKRHQCGRQICAEMHEDDWCSRAERREHETD